MTKEERDGLRDIAHRVIVGGASVYSQRGQLAHGCLQLLDLEEARAEVVAKTARDFVAYYKREGGCANCGGLPHTAGCFVGQFEAALKPRST